MKKIILLTFTLILLICLSCGDDKKENTPKNNIEQQDKTPDKTNTEIAPKKGEPSVKNAVSTAPSQNQFNNAIVEFQNCKASSQNRLDCRNAISKFINETYAINDFKDANNKHVIFDSIQPIISRSSKWKKIGPATSQQNINKALEHTQNGGLSLIIDTSKVYGHLVIVQTGKLTASGSWGIKVPKVFSLANYNPSKSFSNKALSYALKKSEDIQVYIRD